MQDSTTVHGRAIIQGLATLDAECVLGAVQQAHRDGQSLASIVTGLIFPAYLEFEERYTAGEIDAATWTAGTSLLRRALARASAGASPPISSALGRGPVVVTAPGRGPQLFGAEAVAEVISSAGWPVDLLSAELSSGELGRHLDRRHILATVLVCVDTSALPEVAEALDAAHRAGVPVLAVGRGFGSDDLRALRLGADGWVSGLESLVPTLDSWNTERPTPSPVAERPADFRAFVEDRASYVDAVWARTDAVARDRGADVGAGRALLEALTVQLTAALLVDDSRILLSHVSAYAGSARRSPGLDAAITEVLAAYQDVLSDEQARAARFVAEAGELLRRALSRADRSLRSVPAGDRVDAEVAPGTVPTDRSSPVITVPTGIVSANPGQAFADLLLLASLACQVPVSLLSVPQPDGSWSTLSCGAERRDGLNDATFFEAVAQHVEPVEYADLALSLPRSPLSGVPFSLRWAYGVALRAPAPAATHEGLAVVVGVVAVFDRWLRQVSKREQRALQAVARQLITQLSQVRRAPGGWSGGDGRGAIGRPVAMSGDGGWGRQAARVGAATGAKPGSPVVDLMGLRQSVGLADAQPLMRSHEVAVLFDVTERTVINWAASGKLPSLRTIGGHLRFRRDDVERLLAGRRKGTA